jgi:hypothetical protein
MRLTSGFHHVTAIAGQIAKTSSSDTPFSDRTATDQVTF